MQFCDPSTITVNIDRFRIPSKESVGRIAKSIQEHGQLHPILITKDKVLVDGLTRIMACKELEREVWFVTEEDGKLILDNPLLRRVAEFQSNFSRTDFTTAQEAAAIAEVDRLMKEVYGSKKTGPSGTGWTMQDTADKLGYKSHRAVSDAVAITKAIETKAIPGLENVKTTSDALKMIRKKAVLEATEELIRRQALTANDSEIKDPYKHFGDKLILGNCLDEMKKLPAKVCSLFITDPPFGLELDDLIKDRGETYGQTVGLYLDNPTDIIPLVTDIIDQISRVGRDACQVVMFCAAEFWNVLATSFRQKEFKVYRKPLIWLKASTDPFRILGGRTTNPATHPGSAYETAVYAWRGECTLAKQGLPDVFVHQTVMGDKKFHIAQKPISLMEEIISRFYHPGTNPMLIDPFAGSGATLVAAHRLGLKNYLGYELDKTNRERAISFMVQSYLEEQKVLEEEANLEEFA